MSVNLNQEIWVYVERLYIFTYSAEEFQIFLKKFGIEYESDIYPKLSENGPPTSIPLYEFMSEENYAFANFMQTIPSYKYLSILEKVVFDEKIIATRREGWNYYGEYVKNWHPKIIEILKLANVSFDKENKKLSIHEEEEIFEGPDFLPYNFNDLFLDYIRKEINESYRNGQLLAVIILSRKLLEALVIRVFEVAFPKIVNSDYNEENHKLWYDRAKGRHQFLEILLGNLKSKSIDFDEDKDLIEEVCNYINKIRVEANKCVHKDYKIPDEALLKELKIEMATVHIRKVYKKYCNP